MEGVPPIVEEIRDGVLAPGELATREGRPCLMTTLSIQEAQSRLAELIHGLIPGEELILTEDDRPVARLIRTTPPEWKTPRLGTLKGTVLYMAPDFDAPLDDFKDYME
jgi:antitoxin (DNA-binding transcriptional repressor) of toxin-antitoxin stability system